MLSFLTKDIKELPAVTKQIIDAIGHRKIWLLKGRVGAGKTTFLQEVGRQLGVQDEITSPTYALVNEYQTAAREETVFHLDLYRLKSLEEAWQMGLEEYLFSGERCWIEWPELIASLHDDLQPAIIEIETLADFSRRILILEHE